jgi:hypothetical protein
MSTTVQIVAGIVVAAFLLGVAVLEVVSERVRVEPAFPEPAPPYVAEWETGVQPEVERPGEPAKEGADGVRRIIVLHGRPAGDLQP